MLSVIDSLVWQAKLHGNILNTHLLNLPIAYMLWLSLNLTLLLGFSCYFLEI
jgi:hypothetical protein